MRRRASGDRPQQICGNDRSHHGSAITKSKDDFIQVLDSEAVVQSETEAMRPMKQRQTAKNEQINSHQRHSYERHQMLIGRWLHPSQRDSQAEQEQLHGNEQCGNHSAGSEKHPEEGLVGLLRHSRPLSSTHRSTSQEMTA